MKYDKMCLNYKKFSSIDYSMFVTRKLCEAFRYTVVAPNVLEAYDTLFAHSVLAGVMIILLLLLCRYAKYFSPTAILLLLSLFDCLSEIICH